MVRYVSAVILALLIAVLILAPSAEAVLCDGGVGGETADWAYWDYPSVGFIDLNAAYYYYLFNAAENDTLRFEFSGEFPHSRYMSFTLYNVTNQLPVGVLNDFEIEPDPGNQNPFVPGTDRATVDRSYTVRMVPEGSAQAGLPNALVIPADVEIACLLLRVYLPDDGPITIRVDISPNTIAECFSLGNCCAALAEPSDLLKSRLYYDISIGVDETHAIFIPERSHALVERSCTIETGLYGDTSICIHETPFLTRTEWRQPIAEVLG